MKKLLLITMIIGLTSCSSNSFYRELNEYTVAPKQKTSSSGKLLFKSFSFVAPNLAINEPSKAVRIQKAITEHCYTPNDMIRFFQQFDYYASIITNPSVIKSGDIKINQELMNNCHQQYRVFLVEQHSIDHIYTTGTETRIKLNVFPEGLDHYPIVIIRPYKLDF